MKLFGRRTLGLALGSGSARGLAHIGVLKVLEAEGLRPDIITGTSMGAAIGSIYASGASPDDIAHAAMTFDTRGLLGLADVSLQRGAMLHGEHIEEFLRAHLPATFEELEIPFGCVATDLARSESVRMTSGDLVMAVRASMSVPLVFMPVRRANEVLVDGFLTEPVPIAFARDLGADVVVAVEVTGSGTVIIDGDGDSAGLLRSLRSAMRGQSPRRTGISGFTLAAATLETLERSVTAAAVCDADVLISPAVHDVSAFEFLSAERIIAAGEAAATEAVARIRRKARR
jgi:NTE family protein